MIPRVIRGTVGIAPRGSSKRLDIVPEENEEENAAYRDEKKLDGKIYESRNNQAFAKVG